MRHTTGLCSRAPKLMPAPCAAQQGKAGRPLARCPQPNTSQPAGPPHANRTSCFLRVRSTEASESLPAAACLASAARATPPSSSNIAMATWVGVRLWWLCSAASCCAALRRLVTFSVNCLGSMAAVTAGLEC